MRRFVAAVLVAAAVPQDAHACACCTNTGQRYDAVQPLDSGKLDQIAQLRFDPAAELFTSEAEPDVIIAGVTSARFDLQVTQGKGHWVFAFRDKSGSIGTLTLAMPKSISVLAVDTRRGDPEGGLGPALYYEWKLTSPAEGSGMFAPGMGKGQRLTLILQGWGNSCTDPGEATHWTLDVSGPVSRYHLFGKLQR